MQNLDEIFRALGRIEGAIKATSDQVSDMADKQGRLSEEVIEHRGAIKVLATQQAETAKQIMMEIKPVLDDFKEVKNRGIGAIFGISLASGSLGAGFATLIARIWGEGH